MLSTLKYIDASQLVSVLNRKQTIVHEAIKEDSKVDFREELINLPRFRNSLFDATEAFLYQLHSAPLNLHAALSELHTAVNHALGTCLMNTDLNEEAGEALSIADAHRFKFLKNYMGMLKGYFDILHRHSEMLGNGNLVNMGASKPVEVAAEALLIPKHAGVQGVPLNLPPAVKNFDISNLIPEEEADPQLEGYEKLLKKNTPAVFRLTLIKRIRERGGYKYWKTLSTTGQFLIFAQVVGSSLRHAQGNINGENSGRFTWDRHEKEADSFLDRLPKV